MKNYDNNKVIQFRWIVPHNHRCPHLVVWGLSLSRFKIFFAFMVNTLYLQSLLTRTSPDPRLILCRCCPTITISMNIFLIHICSQRLHSQRRFSASTRKLHQYFWVLENSPSCILGIYLGPYRNKPTMLLDYFKFIILNGIIRLFKRDHLKWISYWDPSKLISLVSI